MRTLAPFLLLSIFAAGCGANVVIELDPDFDIEDGDAIVYIATREWSESVGELRASCDAWGCEVRHALEVRPREPIHYELWVDLDRDDLADLARIDLEPGTLPQPDYLDPHGALWVELNPTTYTTRLPVELVPSPHQGGSASSPPVLPQRPQLELPGKPMVVRPERAPCP